MASEIESERGSDKCTIHRFRSYSIYTPKSQSKFINHRVRLNGVKCITTSDGLMGRVREKERVVDRNCYYIQSQMINAEISHNHFDCICLHV